MTVREDNLLLAGDVGGTKTILAVVSPESGAGRPIAESVFENRLYGGFEEIVSDFTSRLDLKVNRGSFSVAGPVFGGAALLTNLNWQIEESRLREVFGWSAADLVNDLQATAYALPHLSTADIFTVQAGNPDPVGSRAVIAPGTGLGESFLLWNGSRFEAFPSEGGNADYAPADALQRDLLAYLQEQFGHVSYEMVCSGVGIPNVYRFLRDTGVAPEPAWLADQLEEAVDPTPVIVDSALRPSRPIEICQATLWLFADILAAEAGNLALRILATGGVYVGGGIPPRILPAFRRTDFADSFCRKGRFTSMMKRFPLYIVLESRAALIGAANYGMTLPGVDPGDRGEPQ